MTVDAVVGVTEVAQAVHVNVLRAMPGRLAGPALRPLVSGTELAYRGVRGIARLAGRGVDGALARLAPLVGERAWPGREPSLAALNGLLGDYFEASGNPLAIAMQWRRGGQPLPPDPAALAAAIPGAGGRIVVSIHGLCMNDLEQRRDGHDHALALEEELGCTAVHLHYNSGRRVSHNGRDLAAALEALAAAWPVPVERVDLLGHSMGGLLARSACHYGREAGHGWVERVGALVFLGTPHHGAPLERGNSWLRHLAGRHRMTAPLARLVDVKSAGIEDLGYGNVRDSDWEGPVEDDRGLPLPRDRRTPLPLPAGVPCYAVAAAMGLPRAARKEKWTDTVGDGLVPLGSALGRHPDPAMDLRIPDDRQAVIAGIHHLDLLGDRAVYARLRDWLR